MTEDAGCGSEQEFAEVFDCYFDRLNDWFAKKGCVKLGLDPEQMAINVLFEFYQKYNQEVRTAERFEQVEPERLVSLMWIVAKQRLKDVLRKHYRRHEKLAVTTGYLSSYMASIEFGTEASVGDIECCDLLEHLECILHGRRKKVLRLLLDNNNSKEISNELGVSHSTIKRDIAKIRELVEYIAN